MVTRVFVFEDGMKRILVTPTFQRGLYRLNGEEVAPLLSAIPEFITRWQRNRDLTKGKLYSHHTFTDGKSCIAPAGDCGCKYVLYYTIVGEDFIPIKVTFLLSFETVERPFLFRQQYMRQAIQHYRRGEYQEVTVDGLLGIIRAYIQD